jgi:hypothetical protein
MQQKLIDDTYQLGWSSLTYPTASFCWISPTNFSSNSILKMIKPTSSPETLPEILNAEVCLDVQVEFC